MSEDDPLIPKHGGYQNLRTFQLAELIYDVTVLFCDRYVNPRSRTHDQMVQAARSGSRNIAEGSVASGTSKKTELKLTNVARASLEELWRDYRAFLRHRGLTEWPPDHPALQRFKARKCASLEEVREWVREERSRHGPARTDTDPHKPVSRPCRSVSVRAGPWPPMCSAHLAANAALSLLNLCRFLLGRQVEAQARAFEDEGGFTERLYRKRRQRRDGP